MENNALRQRAKFIPAIVILFAFVIFLFQMDLGFITPIVIFILLIPLAMFWWVRRMRVQMRGLPPEAAPVISPEKEDILNELAGEWDIVPVNTGPNPNPVFARNIAFSKAYVTGTQITLSGGPRGRTQTQQIYLSRTPTGTLYLDNLGSYIEVWDKVQQEIHINNALNMTLIWRRPRSGVPLTYAAPAIQRPPAVVVLPSWWETMTDANGKVYYKNNHKMTTSWTPPTAEQIAEETRERSALAAENMESQPPPAYNAPPAYETSGASAPPPPAYY